ncbi:MAG: hypothetical protein ACR2OX_11685 [Methyloligellaceae bacterium]
MDTSILLARIIGPMFLVVGLGPLLHPHHYRNMIKAFIQNSELYYFSGVLAFIVGIAMILFHNLWVADWRVVITVIGWMSLFKGTVRILFPTIGVKLVTSFDEKSGLLTALSIPVLIFGVWLSYEGYGG